MCYLQGFIRKKLWWEGGGGRVSYRILRQGGKNHLLPPTYQETVPNIHLWKNSRCFEQVHTTFAVT